MAAAQRPLLGVDLGGTKILAGLAPDAQAPFTASDHRPSEGGTARERILNNLYGAIDAVLDQAGIDSGDLGGLGVCVPGVVDPESGTVLDCTNLAGWTEVPLADLLGQRYRVPVTIENDARAAGWAEATTGAGAGVADQVFVTVSTGIGAALIVGGRLMRGSHGVAGELGETRWPGAGTAEGQASGSAIERRFGISTRELEARCRLGDAAAVRAFGHLVGDLGLLLANAATIVDPELIVVGGGVAQLGAFLLEPLQAEVRRLAYSRAKEVRLVLSRWGSAAGVRGMLSLASTLPWIAAKS